jgi:hypothetical protein
MAKHFYIIGVHGESDSIRIITRAGRREFALEFIEKIKDGQEELYIYESNEDKNHNALEAFNDLWFNEEKRKEFVKQELLNYVTTPKIGNNNEGEFTMDKSKMANGLMLIANGFALMSQAFGVVAAATPTEPTKEEAPKEEKVKKTRTSKPREEAPKAEEVKEEITTQEDDFGDFDFDGEEEKKTYTIEEVRAACVSHAKKNTKEKTYAILKEFGAKSPNDLKKEQYGDVLAKLAV